MRTYQNPIIPGFYPDPSVCRVGDDFYLVNSSFEFFPGVPLWHSRDLVHWEQLGYVLTRPSQLPLDGCRTSGGIYAPTIRHKDGRFYMVTTNVTDGGNFFVWTDDIRGEWSEPVFVKQGGIDPSIFWDDDGKVYFASTHTDENGKQCIGQCEIDLSTGEMLTETRPIWHGTGGKCPEGPHMYKRGNYYYLMIAEGGTEYGHMETMARSRSPWGPFEACPNNPILTHRDAQSEFQGLGHADITDDAEGNYWIVFHAIRPTQFMLHHIGRETMLAPLTWGADGWPVVNGGALITGTMTAPGTQGAPVSFAFADDFSGAALHPRWSYLRNPKSESYKKDCKGITLYGTESTLDDMSAPTMLAVRQQQLDMCYEAAIRLTQGTAALTVFHTAEHHYDLLAERCDGGCNVRLRRRVVDMETETEPVFIASGEALALRIEADRRRYRFLANGVEIGTGSTQLLSTECMICTFTGCFIGVAAFKDGIVTLERFTAAETK